MKLIIQIPCYNEEDTLEETVGDLPESIDGIDDIEVLVVDDGSTDRTSEVAREVGVRHILSLKYNRGLAKAFAAGIERCLELGADIIVNTDADNQYRGEDIRKLVLPILNHEADVVIGDRQTHRIRAFSPSKKLLQRIGSGLVKRLSDVDVRDAVSGFRAYSREAAMQINIMSEFSYTIENIIQLGTEKFKVVSVPIGTNYTSRKSRLHKGSVHFISKQLQTIVRSYAMYKALKTFAYLGIVFLLPGLFLGLRFLYFFVMRPDAATGHVQSLILAAILVIISFMLFVLGIVADLIADNRKLVEKLLFYYRKKEF